MIYLDNAATTLIKPAAVERAVLRTMHRCASPGRGGHRPAMDAARTVYACRERVAELFHMRDPAQVVFTMNATHGLNLAIRSLAQKGTRVLVSGYEHNSVTRPLAQLGADIAVAEALPFEPDRLLDDFRAKLPTAELAVCTHVSNVFGFILPIEEIAALCRAAGVPLIIDASQSAGVLDVDFEKLGAAFIAMPGHKGLFGPQGTGLLLCGRAGEPLMAGGSGSDSLLQQMPDDLPERLEAGTQNVPGIAGLQAGIEFVLERGTDSIAACEREMTRQMIARLQALPELEVFAGGPDSQSGVLSFRPRRRDTDALAQFLADRDICLRSGLHCAPFAHRSAGTLETGTLRASVSPFTTVTDVVECCRAVEDFLRRDG